MRPVNKDPDPRQPHCPIRTLPRPPGPCTEILTDSVEGEHLGRHTRLTQRYSKGLGYQRVSPRFTGGDSQVGAWVFGDTAGCDLAGRRGRDRARASLAAAAAPGLSPALRASLTSSTFSSSTVGSSTIPGMTAAAPTLIRCPQPRRPSPSIPLWVSQVALYHLRMRLERRAGAILCRYRSRRVYAISGSQAG